jgi:hypothetical protein
MSAPPLRKVLFAVTAFCSLLATGCPAPPPAKAVSLSLRGDGAYTFEVSGKDGQKRSYVVREGPGVTLSVPGGDLALDDLGSATLSVLRDDASEIPLSVTVSGGVLLLGDSQILEIPDAGSGTPPHGWLVLGSGAAVPIDPEADAPIWLLSWEGVRPSGDPLRLEFVGSLGFPKEPIQVTSPSGSGTLILGPVDQKRWPGKSPSGWELRGVPLTFDFQKGVASGEGIELRLTHNGPWGPGQPTAAAVGSVTLTATPAGH